MSFKIASFNFENLFSRARVLNLQDPEDTKAILELVAEFQSLLRKATYSDADKRRMLKLYNEGDGGDDKTALKNWLEVGETRGKLFSRRGKRVTGISASGKGDWNGTIQLKRAELSEKAIANTARVVKTVNADVMCLVEVENRPAMLNFRTDQLKKTTTFAPYPHIMVVDGNDQRGIDVGVMSRHPIHLMRSHVDDLSENGRSNIFSRDCLETEILLPDGRSLWILSNHFVSKMNGDPPESKARRKAQSARVRDILKEYDLKKDLVVVAGDLNDTPDSDPISPLATMDDLHDVLKVKHGTDMDQRWTYHYQSNEQIDYLLVSKPLKDVLTDAGVERRGIHGVDRFSGGTIQPFNSITHWTHAASDHGAVWATFDL